MQFGDFLVFDPGGDKQTKVAKRGLVTGDALVTFPITWLSVSNCCVIFIIVTMMITIVVIIIVVLVITIVLVIIIVIVIISIIVNVMR